MWMWPHARGGDSRRLDPALAPCCRDWKFRQIVPAHFTAPVPATPADLKAAFGFLYESGSGGGGAAPGGGVLGKLLGPLLSGGAGRKGVSYPEEDMRALNAAKRFLVSVGAVNK